MKTFLFAALSLVSGFSKDDPNEDIKNLVIETNGEYVIIGTYANINGFWGVNVTNTETEDYFYTFDIDKTKIYRDEEETTIEQVKEGETLKVTYDGSISFEYPPKLNSVSKVEIIDEKLKGPVDND